MTDILQRDHPVLREKSRPVQSSEINSAAIRGIIADMKAAMNEQKDGIAIAAPQIGHSVRIFVVSGTLLKEADKEYKGDGSEMVFINPELTKMSKTKHEVEEGCLSVRWLYGKVHRATQVTLKALNEKGEQLTRGASGVLAQIFQHEVDHLNGVLFTDTANEIWEMSEEEVAEMKKKG